MRQLFTVTSTVTIDMNINIHVYDRDPMNSISDRFERNAL